MKMQMQQAGPMSLESRKSAALSENRTAMGMLNGVVAGKFAKAGNSSGTAPLRAYFTGKIAQGDSLAESHNKGRR